MSTVIDEKIVEMRFDNRQFESGVKTSLGTLDRLKQGLKLDKAAQGLSAVGQAAKNVSFSAMETGVQTISSKFSALEIMAVTTLANITNSAVNTGKRLVSAFTIDPIKTGLQEYETQINAVQTILANTESKGSTLRDVNAALDELNTYADKTIYNFTEMTRNIGTFTAAGVDLETSTAAIKGIANLAAVSGSTSQQASTAMYQLSQALSSGTVKLQDWNSVVNAGMGGQVFQDALKETAKVHGIKIDEMIKKEGSFRETLSKGWLTSEILTETLQKFTGDLTAEQLKSMGYTDEQIKKIIKMGNTANDAATKVKTFTQLMDTLKEAAQSGWTQTWEILIGDFEQAKKLWTSVSDTFGEMINNSAQARNRVLQGWADQGGRFMALEAIKNTFKALLDIIDPIKQAFSEIFPKTTSVQLVKITKAILELTKTFTISEKTAEKIKTTFKGVFATFDIGLMFVKALASGMKSLLSNFTGVSGSILDTSSSVGEWLLNLRNSIKENDTFAKGISKIVDFLKSIPGVLNSVSVSLTGKPIGDNFREISNKIKNAVSSIKESINNLKNIDISGSFSIFDKIKTRLGPIGIVFEGFAKIIKAIFLSFVKLSPVFANVATVFGKILGGIGDAITDALLNTDFNKIMDIFNSGALISLGFGLSKFFRGIGEAVGSGGGILTDLKDIVSGIKNVFSGIGDSIEEFKDNLKSKTLQTVATSIAILAASLFVLSMIDSEKLSASIVAITTLFGELIVSIKTLNSFGDIDKGISSSTKMMTSMAVSVLLMAIALKEVSKIDTNKIYPSLIAITTLIGELVVSSILLSKYSQKGFKGAAQMVIFAVAIKILASTISEISKYSWEEMGKAGVGLLGMISMLVTASILLNKFAKKGFSGSVQLILMSVAIKILAGIGKDISSMSWEEMGKAGVGLLGMISMLVTASILLSNFGGKALVGAIAMIAMASSLVIMAGAIKILGNMKLFDIAKALITLVLAFAVIGGASAILAPLIPVMLALGGAIALVGVGVLSCGVGLLALSIGLGALATAGTAGIMTLILCIEAILGLVPAVAKAIAKGITTIIVTLAESISEIVDAIVKMGVSIINGLSTLLPLLIEFVITLIDSLLKSLAEHMPSIVQSGYDIILALLRGIRDNIGDIIAEGVNILVEFLNAIGENIPKVIQAGVDLILNFIDGLATGIRDNAERVRESVINLCLAIIGAFLTFFGINTDNPLFEENGAKIVDDFIRGVGKKISEAGKKALELGAEFIMKLEEKKKGIFEKGKEYVLKLIAGFINRQDEANKKVKSIVDGVIKSFKDKLNEFKNVGKYLLDGLIDGFNSKIEDAKTAVSNVANSVVDGAKKVFKINSPSKVFMEIGKYVDEGLISGLDQYSDKVRKTTENIGNIAINGMYDAIGNVDSIDAEPTIRPVVDMNNLRNSNIRLNTNIGSSFSTSVNNWSQRLIDAQSAINKSNIAVIDAVNGLRDDMINLFSGNDSEIALYVDSNKLTSTLVNPMNRQLNIISRRGAGL